MASKHDRSLGPNPVEDSSADLRRHGESDKEVEEEEPVCDAVLRSEIWAYSLAKKNTGMKAAMAIDEHQVLHEEGPYAKILTSMSGDAVRISTQTNTTITKSPPMMQAQVPAISPTPQHRLLQSEDAQGDPDGDEHRATVVDAPRWVRSRAWPE